MISRFSGVHSLLPVNRRLQVGAAMLAAIILVDALVALRPGL